MRSHFRTPELQGTELLCPPPLCGHSFHSPRELICWTKGHMQLLPPERFLNSVLYQSESNVPGAPSTAGLLGSSVCPKLVCMSLVEAPLCSCTSGPSWAEFLGRPWPLSPNCRSPTPALRLVAGFLGHTCMPPFLI